MSTQSGPEPMSDIDAGLDELSQETTVADLMREKGQRRKVKVMKESALKEFVRQAVGKVVAENSDRLGDEERQALMAQTEAKLAEVMARANEAESERQRLADESAEKDGRLQTMMAELNLSSEHEKLIQELRQSLANAEQERDDMRADLLVVEQDAENMRKTLEGSIAEKEAVNARMQDTMRQMTMHTTDLVQGVLGLDERLYASRHQEENPSAEDAEGMEEFFHDFGVSAKVIDTLSTDLERLRGIVKQKEEDDANRPTLLESDLQLLEDLKSGSLAAVDVAAPVDNLLEALHGVGDEVAQLQSELAKEGEQPTPPTEVPENEGDPAEVLASATHVTRELAALIAAERVRAAQLKTGASEEHQKALREQMIRSGALVGAVLQVDNEHYGARHQEQNPPPESDDPQESFYNDFQVGSLVMETLSADLQKLKDITAQLKEATGADISEDDGGLLERDLELLHQVKDGSLSAMDVAAPVEGLVEALDGACEEVRALQDQAAEALQVQGEVQQITELPDAEEGEPAQVLAGATQVVRELTAALVQERKRIGALRALADEADEAREAIDREAEEAHGANASICAALAAKGDEFGVDVPDTLTDSAASDNDRASAAEEVIAALVPGLGGDAAQALAAAVVAADADAEELDADAEDSEALLEELRERIAQLGEKASKAQSEAEAALGELEETKAGLLAAKADVDHKREEANAAKAEVEDLRGQTDDLRGHLQEVLQHETELAEHVKNMVRNVEPVLDQDAEAAVEDDVAAVDSAIEEGSQTGGDAAAAADAHGQVNEAMQKLIDSLAARAAVSATKPKADADQVRAMALEISEIAGKGADSDVVLIPTEAEPTAAEPVQADDELDLGDEFAPSDASPEDIEAGERAVAAAMDNEPSDSVEGLLAMTRNKVEALADQKQAIENENQDLQERNDQLRGELRAVKERLDTEVNELEDKKQELESKIAEAESKVAEQEQELVDARELVLSGKEVISHLTEKDKKHSDELQATKGELEQLQAQAVDKDERLSKAEAGCQQLSEALSELSKQVLESPVSDGGREDVEAARVDLEVALSEVPDDVGVPTRPDLSDDLVAAGKDVVDQLVHREATLADEVTSLRNELAGAQGRLDEHEQEKVAFSQQAEDLGGQLEQTKARLTSAQAEVERLNTDVAAKSRELGQTREEAAGYQAELEGLKASIEAKEEQLADLQEKADELDQVRRELDVAKGQVEEAREGHRELAGLVDKLAGLSGQVVQDHDLTNKQDTQRFTRAREKLEGAAQNEDTGVHAIVDRNREVLGQLEDHIGKVGEEIDQTRAARDEAQRDLDEHRQRVSSLEANLADKEHRLAENEEQLAEAQRAAQETGDTLNALQAQHGEQEEKMDELAAELAGFRARDDVGKGGQAEENKRLRDELDDVARAREELEAKLANIDEDHEMEMAGLRSQMDHAKNQVHERDEKIRELQGLLDSEGGKRVDIGAMQAELDAVKVENADHLKRIADLEAMVGEGAGASGRVGSLAEELKNTQQQRDALQTRVTDLELELSGVQGQIDGIKAARDKGKSESERKINKLRLEADGWRKKFEGEKEMTSDLRADLASVEAKLHHRRKSDGGDG